jgi:hypothetical protein
VGGFGVCGVEPPLGFIHHRRRRRRQCLYSPSGPWPLLIRYRNQFLQHTVGLLGQVIRLPQGLYLHGTTQHRKTKDKHPCPKRDSNP